MSACSRSDGGATTSAEVPTKDGGSAKVSPQSGSVSKDLAAMFEDAATCTLSVLALMARGPRDISEPWDTRPRPSPTTSDPGRTREAARRRGAGVRAHVSGPLVSLRTAFCDLGRRARGDHPIDERARSRGWGRQATYRPYLGAIRFTSSHLVATLKTLLTGL